MASLAPTNIALCRRRGDTAADVFEIQDGTGAAIDISLFSFLLTVDERDEPDDSSTQVFQIVGSITDGPNGIVEFAPSSGQADNVGDFFYDIQQTDGGGAVRTIVVGDYEMIQDITK